MIKAPKFTGPGLWFLTGLAVAGVLAFVACSELPKLPEQVSAPKPPPTEPSSIRVDVNPGGPVVFTTSSAIFEIRPDGYTKASLRKNTETLTLDEPPVGAPAESDYPVVGGKELHFVLDFDQARVLEAIGKLGVGKRVEIPSHPLGPGGVNVQRRIAMEVYDKFPDFAITSVEYHNEGATAVTIDRIIAARHRFGTAALQEHGPSYDLWMYSPGSEMKQGEIKLSARYSQRGDAGNESMRVIAFWTPAVGEALGSLDPQAKSLATPVRVDRSGLVDVEVTSGKILLQPGETCRSPRMFLTIFEGDYHEPLHRWSNLLRAEGTPLPEAAQRELIRRGIGAPAKVAEIETKAPVKPKKQHASQGSARPQ